MARIPVLVIVAVWPSITDSGGTLRGETSVAV
jgi:hypothetical protein